MNGVPEEAVARIQKLVADAREAGVREPTAMTLATASRSGHARARTVLLKALDERGFEFYTNTESRKGADLAENPRVALVFHWQPLAKQVNVEGVASPVTNEEADAYWHTRPRESQIGAWASDQSRGLASREALKERFRAVSERFAEVERIDRPPHWHGYRVDPDRIEFWTNREHRLHERVVHECESGVWRSRLLFP